MNLTPPTDPLISIIVITYNSANYVLQTLESAKEQTYQNIELIVSDDGSTDETTSLCADWLSKNKDRFINSEMITVKKNTGIPANCNRGVKAANGEWVKLIAGDDVLMQNCIEDNVEHSRQSTSPLFFSQLEFFNENGRINPDNEQKYLIKKFITRKQKEKTKTYIRSPFFLNTPTFFIQTKTLRSLGGFDENFKWLEDLPFVLKLLLSNYDIDYLNKITVRYRVHQLSVVGKRNKSFTGNLYQTYVTYQRPLLSNLNLMDIIFKLYNDLKFVFLLNGWENTFFFKAFLKVSSILRKLN